LGGGKRFKPNHGKNPHSSERKQGVFSRLNGWKRGREKGTREKKKSPTWCGSFGKGVSTQAKKKKKGKKRITNVIQNNHKTVPGV